MLMNKYYSFCFVAAVIVSNGLYAADNKTSNALKSTISAVSNKQTKLSYKYLKQLVRQGHQEEAITKAKIYLKSYPKNSDVLLLLGQLYFNKKEYFKAVEVLQTAHKITPGYVDVTLVLMNVYYALGDFNAALSVGYASLLRHPGDLRLLKKVSNIYLAEKKKSLKELAAQDKFIGISAVQGSTKVTTTKDKFISKSAIQGSNLVFTEEYERIKKLYDYGAHEEAKQQAIDYLQKYPQDSDVRLVLAKFYLEEKRYHRAREELIIVLENHPRYVDARVILINIEILEKNYQDALRIGKEGLVYDKQNKLLKKKIQDVKGLMYARVKKVPERESVKPIEEKKYEREIGFYQQQYYINDVQQVWDYTTLFYSQNTPLGKTYARLNYSNRFNNEAYQKEIEVFPKINEKLYLDLDIAFGNDPRLFPNQHYAAEAYYALAESLDVSAGARFNNVDRIHSFMVYTGSIAKGIDKLLFTFRPFHYVPNNGKSSTLYVMNGRYIIRDPFLYVGCVLGGGTSPDLANLTTVDFIVLQNRIISPYINFPLFKERLIVNLGYLFQRQVFPNKRVRDWNGGTVGMYWLF